MNKRDTKVYWCPVAEDVPADDKDNEGYSIEVNLRSTGLDKNGEVRYHYAEAFLHYETGIWYNAKSGKEIEFTPDAWNNIEYLNSIRRIKNQEKNVVAMDKYLTRMGARKKFKPHGSNWVIGWVSEEKKFTPVNLLGGIIYTGHYYFDSKEECLDAIRRAPSVKALYKVLFVNKNHVKDVDGTI